MARSELIETPQGPGRVRYYEPGPDVESVATIALGHGAGGGIGASDLMLLARSLPERGYVVVLVEQPWKVAGRKIAGRPPTLDAAWLPILAGTSRVGPLVVGGRSAGARVACRTAAEVGASGVLSLSFPLHPPGKPEASRAPELVAPLAHGIPVRVVQGATDPFGTPDEVRTHLPERGWVAQAAGAHSFGRNPQDVLAATLDFLPALTGG